MAPSLEISDDQAQPLNKSIINGDHDQIKPDGHHRAAKSSSIPSLTASYPTRSLEFLKRQGGAKATNVTAESEPVQAKIKLKVVIVGAGLGGLACAIALARRGHTVLVLEQAPELAEVGAGIQIPSNSSRLLRSWGVERHLGSKVVEPHGMTFRRWKNGEAIAFTKLVPEFRNNFGAPYYVVHRAHFHSALYERALELGVEVRLNSKIIEYDLDTPSVSIGDAVAISADLVVAADGVKSVARKLILGEDDVPPQPTGFAAYRATVDAEKMKQDSDLAWLLERPSLNIWIGPGQHVMTYTIAAGKSFNMVLSHLDSSDPSTWKSENILEDMRAYFADWDPKLVKIINMIESTLKWPLLSGKPLKTWISGSSKTIVLGDAAHAMVPYMSQGAGMAVEDGAALAAVLSLVESREDIAFALKVFETERMKRSGQMQEASLLNGKLWHFADGPEQQARDEATRPEVEGKSFSWSANQWSDPVTQWWAYGYDAEEQAEQAWEECLARKNT